MTPSSPPRRQTCWVPAVEYTRRLREQLVTVIKRDRKIIQVPSCPSLKIRHLVAAVPRLGEMISFLSLMDFSARWWRTVVLKRKHLLFDWCQNHLWWMFATAGRFSAIRLHCNCSEEREKHLAKEQNGFRCARFWCNSSVWVNPAYASRRKAAAPSVSLRLTNREIDTSFSPTVLDLSRPLHRL